MNVGRGLPPLGLAKAADVHAPSTPKARDRPAFELPDRDAPPPTTADAQPRRPIPGNAAAPAARDSARASDDMSAGVDGSATPAQDATKPQAGPGADARHDAPGDGRRAADDPDSRTVIAASGDGTATSAEGGTHRPASDRDEASLPDRMLSLLAGEPLARTPGAAQVVASAASTPAPLAAASAPSAQVGASGLDLASMAVSLPAPALQSSATAIPATADAGAAPAPTVPPPEVAQLRNAHGAATAGPALPVDPAPGANAPVASASTPAGDPFAALAALAERSRGTTPSTGSDTTAPTGNGIAPVLTRGAETLQAPARAPAVAPAPLPLMLDADFDDGLGARVTWMAEQRIDHAQIRVSPESLGPIDVRLQLDGHRVHAQFHAASADVRQALESGMDRLRDMLGRQGMELGQAQVGSGSRQHDGRGNATPAFAGDARGDAPSAEPQGMRVAIPRLRGLLDEYA